MPLWLMLPAPPVTTPPSGPAWAKDAQKLALNSNACGKHAITGRDHSLAAVALFLLLIFLPCPSCFIFYFSVAWVVPGPLFFISICCTLLNIHLLYAVLFAFSGREASLKKWLSTNLTPIPTLPWNNKPGHAVPYYCCSSISSGQRGAFTKPSLLSSKLTYI